MGSANRPRLPCPTYFLLYKFRQYLSSFSSRRREVLDYADGPRLREGVVLCDYAIVVSGRKGGDFAAGKERPRGPQNGVAGGHSEVELKLVDLCFLRIGRRVEGQLFRRVGRALQLVHAG